MVITAVLHLAVMSQDQFPSFPLQKGHCSAITQSNSYVLQSVTNNHMGHRAWQGSPLPGTPAGKVLVQSVDKKASKGHKPQLGSLRSSGRSGKGHHTESGLPLASFSSK